MNSRDREHSEHEHKHDPVEHEHEHEHSDVPATTTSFPSPSTTRIGQEAMQYYTDRQLTAESILSAELSRETSGGNLASAADGSANGVVHHTQSMGAALAPASPAAGGGQDIGGRPSTPDQHQQHILSPFPPGQQVGIDPNHDLSYGEQSARRRRSKISRACDECRRKKVRLVVAITYFLLEYRALTCFFCLLICAGPLRFDY